MSFKNDCKNARIIISNAENESMRRYTRYERMVLLGNITSWTSFKIDRILSELYGEPK